MKLRDRIKQVFSAFAGQTVGTGDEELLQWLGISGTDKGILSEVTYYTCLKMLSETMGKLPIKYYQETEQGKIHAKQTEMTRLLTMRPNQFMTATTMWSTVEMNCQHWGNGYIWMRGTYIKKGKYGGEYKVRDLWPLQSNQVQPITDDAGLFGEKGRLYYQYTDNRTGNQHLFRDAEVMHFKTWYSKDGYMGEPVKNILKETVGGALESQKFMNRLYQQGLTASMAMQYTGDLDEGKRKRLEKKFADALSGPKNAGKVIPIPVGLELTPLKMNLTDAQFFELKKYSALQIAGAFGIKPNQINNYEKSSYANSETQQLAFLVDTMMYRLKMYEEEINSKAQKQEEIQNGFFYKFNEKAILRVDAKTQMQCIVQAVNNGLYTQNEGREFLDKPQKEGGDILMVNGNYIPATMVGKQYDKGGEDSGTSGS